MLPERAEQRTLFAVVRRRLYKALLTPVARPGDDGRFELRCVTIDCVDAERARRYCSSTPALESSAFIVRLGGGMILLTLSRCGAFFTGSKRRGREKLWGRLEIN